MNLKQVIFKDSFIYGSVNYLNLITSTLLTGVYSRIITPEHYGVMDIMNTWNGFIQNMLPLGLTTIVVMIYPDIKDNKDERKKNLGTILTTISFLALIFVLLAFVLKDYFLHEFVGTTDVNISEIYYECLYIIFLNSLNGVFIQLIRANLWKYTYLAVTMSTFLLLTMIGFISVVFLHLDIIGFFRGSVIAVTVGTSIGFWALRKQIYWHFDFAVAKRLISLSIHFVTISFMLQLTEIFDRYLINNKLSLTDVGIYSMGGKISSFTKIFTQSFSLAWYPFAMSVKEKPEAKTAFNTVHKVYVALCVAMALGIFFCRRELMLVFAPGYFGAYMIIAFLTINNIVSGGINLYSLGIHISKKTSYITISMLLSCIVKVAASYILISLWGINGVALSTMIYAFFWIGSQYYFGQKFYPIHFSWQPIAIAMGLLALSLPLSMELDKVFESISWFNPHESTQLSFHWDSGEAVIHIFNSLERWKSILLSILCKVIVLTPALVYIAWYIKKEFKIFNQKIVEIQKG